MSKLFWKSGQLPGIREVMDIAEKPTITTLLNKQNF